jgi:autotransporter-associated beta strand protein
MNNKSRIIVCAMILGTLPCFGTLTNAAQIQFNLTSASGTNNRLPIAITIPLGTSTQTTSLTGDITANLDFTIDSSTHQISSDGITGIGFVYQNDGHILFSNTHYSYAFGLQTIDMTNLKATPDTPVPPGAVSQVTANTYNFDAASHALEINYGTISWAGLLGTGSNDCDTTPISSLTLASTGTLKVSRTADTLTSSTFSINLNLPVDFSYTQTYSGVQITIATSGNNLNATGTYSQTYANAAAYWDTGTATGLQAGNGTWSTASAAWSTGTQGSSPLYAWTADAGTLDAYFNTNGSSTVTVSGNVAAKSMNINGTGYAFTGGTITLNSGGIAASQSATIGSAITLGAAQTWTAAVDKTLAVGGNISAGANALTVDGVGTVSLSGVNSLNILKVGDSTSAGNLSIAGGTTTIISGLVLGFGSAGGGTANLNGGTLSVGSVSRNSGSTAAATFNFNGGTLRATAANTAFMAGLTNAFVKEGGAKIDTLGFDIAIGQALQHGGTAATDGGLSKTGTGKLTLTGAITYKGLTAINGGTLVLDNNLTTTLGAISGTGNLSVGPMSTLFATSINVNTLSIGSTGGAMAVPEPAALSLLAIAGIFGGFALLHFRR